MIYSNPEFLILLTITGGFFFLAKRQAARFWILLTASLLFYAWTGLFDTGIFLFVITVSWLAVAMTNRYPSGKIWFIRMGIAIMTAHLFFWKYTPWVVSQLQILLPSFWGGQKLSLPLPIGISFFTLQGIAYLVDYSRREAKYMRLPTYLLFKSFFAQLVAGPIVRASQLLPQLETLERPSFEDVSLGLVLFTRGFFKKLVIADRVAAFVDIVFSNPGGFGRVVLIKALLGYTVQIWADFSGYTDMGRGAAAMLGIRLPENFLSPYLSRRPSEFWRRWHITLSEWMRDYIYTPLALSLGSGSAAQALLAVVITMGLCGFWHGAEWHFMVWGLYHGLLLVAEHQLNLHSPSFGNGLRTAFQTASMFFFITFGWLIFRAENLHILMSYLGGFWTNAGTTGAPSRGLTIALGAAYCGSEQIISYRDLKSGNYVFLSSCRTAIKNVFQEGREDWIFFAGAFFGGMALAGIFVGSILMRPLVAKSFVYFQF